MWFKSSFTVPAVAAIGLWLIGGTDLAATDILHVPGDFPTIQAAIDAAVNGDEVVVADGTYMGGGNRDLDFAGKLIIVRSENGPDNCIIDCGQSARGFHFHSGENDQTIVDGFTIQNGSATIGGAILCESSSPTIRNCTFVGNSASQSGAGMRNTNSSPTVTNCTFSDNAAGCNGGGMANFRNSNPTVSDCTFTGNFAFDDGGGMRNQQNSHPMLIDCTFTDNIANGNGAGVYNIFSCSPTVVNCRFVGNVCGHVGGAFGIRQDCHPVLINCSFINNTAGDFGGAIRSGNTGSSPTIINCLFVGNAAQIGGAYAAGTDIVGPIGLSLLQNCIFWGNTAALGPQIALNGNQPADVTVTFSDVQGGEADVYVERGFTLTWGPGNIDADPLFVDPENGNLRLSPDSPCIDAGNNWGVPIDENDYDEDGILCELFPVDLDGNRRFNADEVDFDPGCGVPVVVDMGAYEYQFDPADQVTFADLNSDDTVGAADLLGLLVSWGACAKGCCLADLDLDGSVGASDLLALLVNWGPCP
ncbi:MAG: right-handed parallel beta-helix repeat-containing protein [Phycisphaerales bacterium]